MSVVCHPKNVQPDQLDTGHQLIFLLRHQEDGLFLFLNVT